MISSLVSRSPFKIPVNGRGKFSVDETNFSVKDIPTIEYIIRDNYEEWAKAIDDNKKLFPYTVHIVRCKAYLVKEIMASLEAYEWKHINSKEKLFKEIAILVELDIVENGDKSEVEGLEETVRILDKPTRRAIDRFVLVDRTKKMGYIELTGHMQRTSEMFDINVVVCCSAFSTEKNCCLPAEYVRHMQALYVKTEFIPLSVLGHQEEAMDTGCRCVRKMEISKENVKAVEIKARNMVNDSEKGKKTGKVIKRNKGNPMPKIL